MLDQLFKNEDLRERLLADQWGRTSTYWRHDCSNSAIATRKPGNWSGQRPRSDCGLPSVGSRRRTPAKQSWRIPGYPKADSEREGYRWHCRLQPITGITGIGGSALQAGRTCAW